MEKPLPSGIIAFGQDRRQAAPHPGPEIQRDFLDPLHLDVATLAAEIQMDRDTLRRMLSGQASIDVETAIRLGRSLQINPRLVMERQVSHDFSILRADPSLEELPVLAIKHSAPFPNSGFLSGHLTGLRESWGYGDVRSETLAFSVDHGERTYSYRRMYAIKRGSRLRVYGPGGQPLWAGVVLETFEGRPILPCVRPGTWIDWFVNRFRADFIPAA